MAGVKRASQAPRVDDDSRARIIAAARSSFASVGFEGASTRQIAAEAGVAQSLLLYHFGSKDALWRAVMDDLFAGLSAHLAQAQADLHGASITVQLLALVAGFVQLCAENADVHRIMTLEGRRETDRLKWLVDRHLRVTADQMCALIRRGQDAGLVRAGDPMLLYYSVIAIAGTAFSLAPEIRLVSRNDQAVDPAAITALIQSMLLIGG